MNLSDKKGTKVVLEDVHYGTDGQKCTWGTASVKVVDPQYNTTSRMGKVNAVVKLQDGDVFNKETGEKLVFNILKRKALSRYSKQLIQNLYLWNKIRESTDQTLASLEHKQTELECEFESLSYPD